MPHFKSSLRNRFILSSLLVSLISLGAVAWLVQSVLRDALEKSTHQTLENQVVATAQSLDAFYAERRSDLRNLSDAAKSGTDSPATLNDRLDSFQLADSSFEALYQIDAAGRVVAATRRPHLGRQIAELIPEIASALALLPSKKAGTIIFLDFTSTSAAGALRANGDDMSLDDFKLKMLTAVRSRDGTAIGAIVAVLDDDAIARAVAQLKGKLGRLGDAYLLTTDGRVLVANGGDTLLQVHPDWEATRLSERIAVQAAGSLAFKEPDGSTTIASYSLTEPLEGSGRWILVAESPIEVAMAPVAVVLRNIGGILLVTLVLSVVVAVLNARRVLAPLDRLAQAANAIGGGALGVRMDVPRERELAVVAHAFNEMVGQRELATENLEKSARELAAAGEFIENERAQLAIRVEERTAELSTSNDKLEAMLRGKSAFLATMSHEIRTPINGLMGTLELLSLTDLALEQHEMLQGSRDAGTGLLRIIDDILDYSKIEAGKMSLLPAPTSIAGLMARTVGTYRSVASMKGLSLSSKVDANISATLMVDPVRLSQIVNNFVSNAVKFTTTGTVAIEVVLVERTHNAERIRFTVTDSGIGIDKTTHARLFGAYEQGALDTARVYGGTGLGLSICKRLTEMMGGELALESEPGKGSRFSVSLTLAVAESQAGCLTSATTSSQSNPRQPVKLDLVDEACRVMCADDFGMNRMLIQRQLKVLGVNAQVVDSGEAALEAWRDGDFSLLITDCHMPGLDGYGLARAIRAEEASSGRPRMPIIAWTANAFESEIGLCVEAGMDACLSKPCDLQKLRDAVSPWLEKGHGAALTNALLEITA